MIPNPILNEQGFIFYESAVSSRVIPRSFLCFLCMFQKVCERNGNHKENLRDIRNFSWFITSKNVKF